MSERPSSRPTSSATSSSEMTTVEQQMVDQFAQMQQPCTRSLGDGHVVKVEQAVSRITMDFTSDAQHCHSGDIVQGGFVTGMLDSAMSMAVFCHTNFQQSPATLEIKTTFLDKTTIGLNRAVGWVVQAGKTIAFVEGELYNDAGELLAKASSSARLVPARNRS